LIAIFFFVLVSFDQISKYIIRHTGGFYICNKGVSFGLPFFTLAFFILGIFLFFYVFNLKFKIFNLKSISNLKFQILNYSKLTLLGIILIISGGLSNIADRIMSGCVIDFIDLKFWPVFNLADIYITIGGIIILCVLFFKQR